MSTLPGLLRLTPAFPFAGRTRELAALTALLPRANGEGRRVALVAGEPGSGKSRLVRELAERLAAEGALVLYGACDAVVPAPYGPFVEALDRLVRQAEPQQLRADLGPAGGELTRLLPDLPSIVGGLPEPLAADADAERHRLHTAIVELLASLGARAPVLLVLEDVHWADATTLHVVRHLARAGADARMLLVVTFRDAEADMPAELGETLVDVARSEGVVRMRLGGLSDDDVGEFVRNATGAEADREARETIGRLTDGNAFLLTELWRELVESNAIEVRASSVCLTRPVAEIGTPETVREVVTQRLARLDSVTGQVLELAAVIGPEFELETVRRAAALPEGQLLDAVDAAVHGGLVVEAHGRRLAYRFAHELVRRAVVDRLSAPRRAEIHLRVAEALETGSSDGDDRGRLASLAYHFAEAAPVGGVTQAITYNLLAAESAATALAFDEAAERLRTALMLGIDDPRERGQASLRLGYARHRGGRSTDALEAFQDAAALARELDDPVLLARAAVGFEESCWRPGIHGEGSIELLEEAAGSTGADPSELRVRLLGALARALDFTGEYGRAAVAREEAITMARSRGDREALGWVLSASYWSRGVTSNDEINRMLTEACEIGEELGDVALRTEALAWLVPSYVALCDHSAAAAMLDRLFELASRLHEPFYMHVAAHYASALALCDGNLAGAEAAALRSHEWSRLLTGRDASGVHGIQMFGIRREQGRLAELAPVVRVLATEDRPGAWAPGLVVTLATLGLEDEARRELGRLRSTGLGPLQESLWLAGLTYLADACSLLDDEESAAFLYPELAPYRGTNIQVGHLVSCHGAADRYLGTLLAVQGEWDLAESHFESALQLNRDLGARTWLAHTMYQYGRMLLRRARPDDRRAANGLLGDALALAKEVGMPALSSRVGALGTALADPPAHRDGLSAREVEILRLVARGLSNREIGAALFISEHTAANHIRSILRKTSSSNRTEAASYAHRRGLATS